MAGQSFSVLNNLSSMKAQKDLYFTNIGLNKTLAKLSSGRRIVEAADDAAGLAIASSLKADAMALEQAVRNANDGIAIVQIADGALSKMTDLLMRAVTLAEQAASDTVGADEKNTLNIEYRELLSELDRIVSVTNFKGSLLFNPDEAVQFEIATGDTHFHAFELISIGGINGVGSEALGLKNRYVCILPGKKDPGGWVCGLVGAVRDTSIETRLDAVDTLQKLNGAIASVSRMRGVLGAQQNRLIHTIGRIQIQELNIRAAESTITDANMAAEIVNMTKYQILMQTGMASLAQANASAQQVLQLLR